MKRMLFYALSALALLSCSGKGADSGDNQPEPYILSVTTDYDGKAVAGENVTVHGLNFSPVAAENKVLYGIGLDAVALPVTESSEEHLVFRAPTVTATQIKIHVSVRGKDSNLFPLNFTTAPEKPVEEPWSDTPTLDFAKLGGTTVEIVPGVEWTSFHGSWEGQIRNINIVRSRLNEHNSLGIYYNYTTTYPNGYTPELAEGEDPRDLDKKCIYLDAVAGTNGPMACCHFVRMDGEIVHTANEQDPWIVNCAITIDDNNVIDIVKVKDNYAAARLTNKNVGCAGPLLVWEGVVQEYPDLAKQDFIMTTHPRTAIGLSKDGKTVVQVAVDGRWTQSSSEERAIGMSTTLLGKMMKGLGCYKAMNFDGGGGTAMWVYGQGNARNIVNRVSENRWNWNGTTLRPTGNAVYIKSDLKK